MVFSFCLICKGLVGVHWLWLQWFPQYNLPGDCVLQGAVYSTPDGWVRMKFECTFSAIQQSLRLSASIVTVWTVETEWPCGQHVGLAIQWFEFCSDHDVDLYHSRPKFRSSAMLVNSQLVCLRPVGILNNVMFNLNYLFHLFARPH